MKLQQALQFKFAVGQLTHLQVLPLTQRPFVHTCLQTPIQHSAMHERSHQPHCLHCLHLRACLACRSISFAPAVILSGEISTSSKGTELCLLT